MHIKIFIMPIKGLFFSSDIDKTWTFLKVKTSARLQSSTVYCLHKEKNVIYISCNICRYNTDLHLNKG